MLKSEDLNLNIILFIEDPYDYFGINSLFDNDMTHNVDNTRDFR